MRRMRQNVIVGHGGSHGPNSRTLRKGQAVTLKDMKQIPDHVLGQTTALGVDAPKGGGKTTADRIRERDAKIAQDEGKKGKKAKCKGKPAEKPKATKLKADPAPPKATKPPKAEEPKALEAPATKRELFLLKKAEAVALLDSLGVKHDADISGAAAKELLGQQLGLVEKPSAE